jgi:hypothetical protein
LFGRCCDDYDDADNLLLLLFFLSLNPVFMSMLTEQPSGQLQKKHQYKQITSNQGEEQRYDKKTKEK